MVNTQQQTDSAGAGSNGEIEQFDAIVIGAGVTGLYALYRLRQLGFSARAIDEASGVGGTWYWNRYPGCRFDSESYSYGYSFSEELLQEWDWKEHYSGQPENERYLNYVADKFDLRRDIQFNTRIKSAKFDATENRWLVEGTDGSKVKGQFLLTAVGILSAGYTPDFEGINDFKGAWTHTGRWPKEGMDLKGKRVGVVGTGATAIQLIPMIAPEVSHLTVFQRTANYTAPLRNGPIDADTMQEIKGNYEEIFEACNETAGSFMHKFDQRSAMSVSPEERLEQHEKLWKKPGFGKWLSNFRDVMVPGEANEDYSEFVRGKIREQVNDPVVAEMLVPNDHTFGSKRVPCETGYYEAFNRDNVSLIDVRKAPIERITENGVKTTDAEYELDVIIYATGYDAVTGALLNIDIYGEDGKTLREKFTEGPRTYMGISSVGYPNLFTVNAASVGNFVRAAEPLMDWVTDCMVYVRDNGYTSIVPTQEAEDAWVKHVNEDGKKILRTQHPAWFNGGNIPGKARALLTAPDTAPVMRAKRLDVAAKGYEGFTLK
ncbi:MAG: NAD(P)/FAD-dependent oxidoreductase [Dehalococcoidia bacterium]|nr:NAD(P)/FAD-dependent oxidoreductase [Dehalococcoidia bacterium]